MNHPFYQVKGALPANAPSYIKRDADDKLYEALIHNKYCYVLNYRQVGKSSLKNSCANRLEKIGHQCIHIELTAIGSNDIDIEKWYFSFMYIFIKKLNLSQKKFVECWRNKNLTVISRVALIIDEIILKECHKKITVFIDEIDFILSINKFNTDNFFALIRRFYNLRGEDERYNQLTFVLLGVASAKDLMQDSSRTPFNIAENIKISQLKLNQSYRLIDGLNKQTIDKEKILERVFNYTSGTSFLTQKILEHIAKHPLKSLDEIENIIEKLFIQEGFNEVNLSNIQERIIKNKTHNVEMLYTIEEIQNGKNIEDDGRKETFIYLKLSGLIKVEDGILTYSNLIYKKTFNTVWLGKMIDKLDRPILKHLRKWKQFNLSSEYLLKEERLKKITKWAYSRSDLLAIEHEYLSLSHQEEHRKAREKLKKEQEKIIEKFLEEEKKFNQKLLEQKERANMNLLKEEQKFNKKSLKQKKIMALILSMIFLTTIAMVYYYINKQKETEKIRIETEKRNLEIESLKKQKEIESLKKQNLKQGIEQLHLENEKLSLKVENKKLEAYYTELLNSKLTGGPKEYLWRIKTYEFLEKESGKYKAEIIDASIKLANLSKDTKQSEKYYLKAINLYKTDKEKDEKKIAELYYQLGEKTNNIEYYNQAMDFYKKNPFTYIVKIAKIHYQLGDIFITKKQYKEADEQYKKGFKLYKNLLTKEPNKYISILADSFVKKATIYQSKKNNKETKTYYLKALNIYKINTKILDAQKIKEIERALKVYPYNHYKETRGWVYLGNFYKKVWQKQYFWFQKEDTLRLNNTSAIALDSIYFRARPSIKATHLRDISIGDKITILRTKTIKRDKANHIWALVLY